jgi:putative AlgH/UPF0301 family transcriptional regulator
MDPRVSSINLTHHFLIAMPSMVDPYFAKTLTYVCEHSEQGALGIVVNRPIDMTLQALFERLSLTLEGREMRDAPIYFGGPVQTDRGFVLHAPCRAMAIDAARARRDRADDLEGHPRGGRARRRSAEDAGHAGLCRLVRRTDRA